MRAAHRAILTTLCVCGFAVLGAGTSQPSQPSSSGPVVGSLPAPSDPSAAPEPAAPPEPPVEVTARQLFTEYQANEVGADSRYRGRRLRVTGVVEAVRRDFLDNMILDLRTSNRFMSVHCNLVEGQAASVGALSPGDSVTVVGEGGTMIIGQPQITDCQIEQ